MKKNLIDFINKEKEISLYKIEILNRGNDKVYKKRLIKKEQDFIDFPFCDLSIDNLDSLREAIDLFRDNRELFEKKWKINNTNLSDMDLSKIIENKINFYERIFASLIDNNIKKIGSNFISKKLENSDNAFFENIEGIRHAKKRARIQILIYCVARYINYNIKSIKTKLLMDNIDYNDLNLELDSFLEKYIDHIFCYYNSGIKELPIIVDGTDGDNSHISSIYPLINLFDKLEQKTLCLKRIPNISVFTEYCKPINRKHSERAFSISIPINRVGNEWMEILYCNILSITGKDITRILNYKDFYNLPLDKEYIKAIPTYPIWDLIDNIENYSFKDEILNLLNLSDGLVSRNKNTAKIINQSNGIIDINQKNSVILIPATRSESDHIKDALGWVKILINNILEDYKATAWDKYGYQ